MYLVKKSTFPGPCHPISVSNGIIHFFGGVLAVWLPSRYLQLQFCFSDAL